jgi:hypothetical protein
MLMRRLALLSIGALAFAAQAGDPALAYYWRPIAQGAYPETEDPEVRDIGDADPDALVAGEFAGMVLLGKTAREGTSAKEFQMEAMGERVGATLVLYWISKYDAKVSRGDEHERTLHASRDGTVTLSGQKSDSHLPTRTKTVTVGEVHAIYLRDCAKAPCAEAEARPVLGTLRNCEFARCAPPPPMHQRGFYRLDKKAYAPTEMVAVERIEGAQVNDVVGSRFATAAILGKSVVPWDGGQEAPIVEQARRVGATQVLWWQDVSGDEHAVYLRECDKAAC